MPPAPPRRVLGNLGHADAQPRADAAWEAGLLRLKAASPGLRKLLGDRDATVRRNAAWALGELGQPESAFPIQERIIREREPAVLAELAIALGKVRHLPARPLLLGLTWRTDPLLKAAGITAVGHLGDSTAAQYLLRFLTHPDPVLRRALAEALGRTGGPNARPSLLRLLGDPVGAVQVAALEAACRLGMEEAASQAERLLGAGPVELRSAAAAALRTLGTRRHLAALAPLLEDEHPEVAAQAALTSAHLGGTIPSERLRALLTSRHNAATRAAARAAGLGGNRVLIPELEALLDHASLPLRESAAEALGRLAAAQSLPRLLRRLPDAPPREQQGLLVAIGALRDTSALTAVAPLLSHEDAEVQAAAVGALAQMATLDPRPIAFLAQLITPLLSPHLAPTLLRASADAFTRVSPPRPRAGFIALLRLTLHPEAGVRGAAARSLGRYGDRLARSTLERLRQDPDPAVRLEAYLALLRLDYPRGRPAGPGAGLPDCDLHPPATRTRCLLVRAAWVWRERNSARAALRRFLRESPNTPQTATIVDLLTELPASFAIPLLNEARRSWGYLLRAAADRALCIWPPHARPPASDVVPTTPDPRTAGAGGTRATPDRPPLFDPGGPEAGCGCGAAGTGRIRPGAVVLWLLLVVWQFYRRRAPLLASHRRHCLLRVTVS